MGLEWNDHIPFLSAMQNAFLSKKYEVLSVAHPYS